MKKQLAAGICVIALVIFFGCGNGSTGSSTSGGNATTTTGPTVTIGFWSTADCSGATLSTISFPVDYGNTSCYSWPGHSGENSATNFLCGANSFTYTQWGSLTCSGGQNPGGTVKTAFTDTCTQDIPPTLYSRIVDFSGCN